VSQRFVTRNRKWSSVALSFAVASTAAATITVGRTRAVAAEEVPVKGILSRALPPGAPAGANAIRLSLFGDGSGAHFQVRLLSQGQDGVLTGYFAAPDTVVDWKGWKTLVLPLSTFTFHSDVAPNAAQDGVGSAANLLSAVKMQFAVTAGNTDLYIDDIGWSTDSAAPTDAPLGVIDDLDGTGPLDTFQKAGDYEQQLNIRFNRTRQNAKSGGALQIVVAAPSVATRSNRTAVDAFVKKAPQVGYVAFVPVSVFTPIEPNTVPTLADAKAPPKISIFACADEIEPATFAVYSSTALKNATVKIAVPLTSPAKKVIPNAAIDLRVVRVAPVANGPQLLMKDDRESLSGPMPTVRLTGDPTTDIAAGTSKQFWITVKVPRLQTPGVYSGKLTFSATGAKPTTIPFTVEVLPLTLKTAFLQYGIDMPTRLADADAQAGETVVPADQFSAQLADIRDHGFRMVALHDRPGGSLENALSLYKQANLSPTGPVIVAVPLRDAGEVTALENLRGTLGTGFDIFYHLPANTAEAGNYAALVTAANQRAKLSRNIDSIIEYAGFSQALNDAPGERLAPLYSLSSDYVQKLLATGKRDTANRDYWTWDISQQSPMRNRLFAGMLLYKTGPGLYGAFPGPYQSVPGGSNPFALFDPQRDPNTPRPALVAYPVQGGVLDTIQWEAVREGVDDIRYIGVLKSASRELKDLKLRKDATDLAESYLIGVARKDLLSLSPVTHQLHRRTIADQSLKLLKLLPKGKP
jgi:hypothetical protein